MIKLFLLGFYLETKKYSSKRAIAIMRNNMVFMITSMAVFIFSYINLSIVYFLIIIFVIPLTSRFWLPIKNIYNYLDVYNNNNEVIKRRKLLILFSNLLYFSFGFLMIYGIYRIFSYA